VAIAAWLVAGNAWGEVLIDRSANWVKGGAFRRPVIGTIIRTPTGHAFSPASDATLAIPLATGQAVPDAAIGPTLSVSAEPSADGNGLKLKSLDLEALKSAPKWSGAVQSELVNALNVLQLSASLALQVHDKNPGIDRATEVLQATTDQANAEQLAAQLSLTEEQIVAEYLRVLTGPDSPRQRAALIDLFLKLRRDQKAIYGRPDYFPAVNYRLIYESSKSSVAIVVADEARPICSGVLVAADLVLTARHCLTEYLAPELEIWVGYEEDANGKVSHGVPFHVEAKVVEGAPLEVGGASFDYVLLRLRPGPAGQKAGDVVPPRCLSEARLNRDHPIYVVGHPDGAARTIHDNAWVLFPFAATPAQYGRLMLLVEAELKNDPERGRWVQQFRADYRKNADGALYEYFSSRLGRQPVLAAEADTFHGDSGAPVFDRRKQTLVGIVVAGEPDVNEPWEPGWRRHESIIPASQILADVTARSPSVLAELKVCRPAPAGQPSPAEVAVQ
jgi:V8-like Glu-specific endopeptidase